MSLPLWLRVWCFVGLLFLGAWTHGITPGVASNSFGADTPAGFGGLSYADLGYSGVAGSLQILAQYDRNGDPLGSPIFAEDADNLLVATGTYGAAPPADWATCPTDGSTCYTVQLSGAGYFKNVAISVTPNTANWTSRCQSLSGTACVDAAGHADAKLQSELRTLVGTAWPQAESVVGRPLPCSPTCGVGFSQAGLQFEVLVPNAGYAGLLTISQQSGGSGPTPWGEVCWRMGTDIDITTKLSGLTHILHAANAGSNSNLLSNCNGDKGWGMISDAEIYAGGPEVTDVYNLDAFTWLYRPSRGVGCGGQVNCLAATVTRATIRNVENGIVINDPNSLPSPGNPCCTGDAFVGGVVQWNTVYEFTQDAIRVGPAPTTSVLYNLIFAPLGCCGSHVDSVQIDPTFTGFTMSSMGEYGYNFMVRGKINLGATLLTVSVTSRGSGASPLGPYQTPVIVQGGSGLYGTGRITIGADGGLASFVPLDAEGQGGGYSVGDVLTLVRGFHGCCLGLVGEQMLVTAVSTQRADSQEAVHFNNVLRGFPGDTGLALNVHHNIAISANNANGTSSNHVSNTTVNNNDYLLDVQTVNAPPPPGFGGLHAAPLKIVAKAASVGFNGDYNLAGGWNITAATGTVSCLPGTAPTSCRSVAANLAAYQAVLPSYDVNSLSYPPTRAQIILMMQAKYTGDKAYEGTIWPADHLGQLCWAATGIVFHFAADCTSVSSLAQ